MSESIKVAGIVLYNPDYDVLNKSISIIASQVDMVFLYCNSYIDANRLINQDFVLINDSESTNDGIAHALNVIMERALDIGASWCLFLDQDSIPPNDIISQYERYTSLPNAGILTSQVIDRRSQENEERGVVGDSIWEQVSLCITSGSYNNVFVWKQSGGFDENLFIDYVDWEYCARIRKRGYEIYKINSVVLDHELGRLEYYELFHHKIPSYNHNAFRKYFITRNSFIIHRAYPEVSEFKHPMLRTLKRLLIVVAFESDKKNKVKAVIRGIKDYKQIRGSVRG